MQFVTWRLADALPQGLLKEWMEERAIWLGLHPSPWSEETEREYRRHFSQRMEQWLDAGHGACILGQAEFSEIVEKTLRHFDGVKFDLIAYVIMPNHIHLIVKPTKEKNLSKLVQGWKSWSAREINRRLGQEGTVWQEEYWDRLVRDEAHLERCIRYIANNPAKAGLREGQYRLFVPENGAPAPL
ncbi:MAG: transposase [bacterium]